LDRSGTNLLSRRRSDGRRNGNAGRLDWREPQDHLSGAPCHPSDANFLQAAVIEALGEAIALIGKAGIDRRKYIDILTSTVFTAPAYKIFGSLIAEGSFEPAAFAAPLGYKDIRLALAAAESLRVPMPLANLLHDRFTRLFAQGGERLDWAAIGALAGQDAGETSPT
jgi:hypothetical protein